MDKQRMLIVGARGFLGTYAVEAARATGEFHVVRGDRHPIETEAETEVVAIDIADRACVDRAFQIAQPDCVLLLAAMADIDRCEAAPELAFGINAHGAEHIANACARHRARLLFTSSAAVFDGNKLSYDENQTPSPVSVYGKSKLWAEQAVLSLLPSAVVLRFALVLGFARKRGTNAMLDMLLAKWRAGEPAAFSTQERRNPIDAGSLSQIMLQLIANPSLNGIYHAGASDCLSRYELGLRLAARACIAAGLVLPQTEPVPGRAPRGIHHFLLTDKLLRSCRVEPIASEQVIERCFA